MRKVRLRTAIFVLALLCAVSARAEVLTGKVENYASGKDNIKFGDGMNVVRTYWTFSSETSGLFYGTAFGEGLSNADIYVYKDLDNPASVSNAESFAYTSGSVMAEARDTVFFRTKDGYYGAFVATEIQQNEEFDPLRKDHSKAVAFLTGKWYFQADKSGDFTQ